MKKQLRSAGTPYRTAMSTWHTHPHTHRYELAEARGLKGVMIWMLNGCTRSEAPAIGQGLAKAFGPR